MLPGVGDYKECHSSTAQKSGNFSVEAQDDSSMMSGQRVETRYNQSVLTAKILIKYGAIVDQVGELHNRKPANCRGQYVPVALVKEVNMILNDLIKEDTDLWQLNCLVYSVSNFIEEEIRLAKKDQHKSGGTRV